MKAKAEEIVIIGAKSHNLQNVSLAIPRGKFVVITGLSGSGKTQLAIQFCKFVAEGRSAIVSVGAVSATSFAVP